MNSFNHYTLGSIAEWMYTGVSGIRRVEEYPGFSRFILNPLYGGSLTYAKGHFDSMFERIHSNWT
jgi:alpha-L-rhamnosidase